MYEGTYVSVMQKAIHQIQSISPDRVIFVDGLVYGRKLILSLKNERNVIQALHVYDPMTLTHYKASWVAGSDSWPLPVWPVTDITPYLYGPWKSEFYSSLIFEGTFGQNTEITLNLNQVSIQSNLQVKLDNDVIFNREFICGPEPGEDFTRIVSTQWGYQNISGKDYSVVLPRDGTRLTIANTDGDWLTLNKITLRSDTGELVIIPANTEWGLKQATYRIAADGKITDTDGNPVVALTNLIKNLDDASNGNIPVMIQEFGVYNQTPHDVTLAYLTDVISVFNRKGVGYAMWNLIGTMGIINSERTGFIYESYRGKLLDREMTSIMQGQ